jgi:predicted membrane channel-forming protein YqfA (hemolysin III family)
LINKIWAKRLNVAISAVIVTIAFACLWIFRCEYGECPEKQTALYIMFACSIVVLLGSLLPDIKLKPEL